MWPWKAPAPAGNPFITSWKWKTWRFCQCQAYQKRPRRKTDVKDAEWIANLLQHGLTQGSFIPSREQQELRELDRYRRSLIEE
jgi:hypothetical protein